MNKEEEGIERLRLMKMTRRVSQVFMFFLSLLPLLSFCLVTLFKSINQLKHGKPWKHKMNQLKFISNMCAKNPMTNKELYFLLEYSYLFRLNISSKLLRNMQEILRKYLFLICCWIHIWKYQKLVR